MENEVNVLHIVSADGKNFVHGRTNSHKEYEGQLHSNGTTLDLKVNGVLDQVEIRKNVIFEFAGERWILKN